MKLLVDVGLLDFKAQEGPTGLSGCRFRFLGCRVQDPGLRVKAFRVQSAAGCLQA